jgi:pilus assembly protein CpaB
MEKKGVMLPVLIAVIAAILYWAALTSREAKDNKENETANVLVARVDLPPRTVLKEGLVDTVAMPRKFIQKDAYEVRSLTDVKLVSNLVTKIRIPKGNQLSQYALIPLGPDAGLSVKVPPGYRGVVLDVPVNFLRLVKPGDRVDVYLTFDAVLNTGKKDKFSLALLQNIQVLGVGSNLGQGMSSEQKKQRDEEEKETRAFSDKAPISLALNPKEAQYLSLAKEQGELMVVVRGLGDLEMYPLEAESFTRIFQKK